MLFGILKSDPWRNKARLLQASIAERARLPVFYARLGVPDTIDGRFDVLALHVFLVMEAMRAQGKAAALLSEALATATFEAFEGALRDLGVGDIGLPRRMKAMANAFYGRLQAYRTAASSDDAFAAAVRRNLYRGDASKTPESECIARYALAALRHLEGKELHATLMSGVADFGPPPEMTR